MVNSGRKIHFSGRGVPRKYQPLNQTFLKASIRQPTIAFEPHWPVDLRVPDNDALQRAIRGQSRQTFPDQRASTSSSLPLPLDRDGTKPEALAVKIDNNEEPFWLDYANADLPGMMRDAGFDNEAIDAAYLEAVDGPIPWYVVTAVR